jgi:hypothetical protein
MAAAAALSQAEAPMEQAAVVGMVPAQVPACARRRRMWTWASPGSAGTPWPP